AVRKAKLRSCLRPATNVVNAAEKSEASPLPASDQRPAGKFLRGSTANPHLPHRGSLRCLR
ncbi:unnamed protein product, partial [Musa acuminata subsp. burmannicoides]